MLAHTVAPRACILITVPCAAPLICVFARTAGVRPLLELLAAIIRGFDQPNGTHTSLVRDVLCPLHKPTARLDESTPVLSLYHEPLCHCLVALLSRQPPLLLAALPPLLGAWPEMREGNSAKEVLLLHEIERLLELATPPIRPTASLMLGAQREANPRPLLRGRLHPG